MKMARTDDAVDEPRLSFLLPDAGRLADWPETPLPDVDFTLHAEGDFETDENPWYQRLTDAYVAWSPCDEFELKVGKQGMAFTHHLAKGIIGQFTLCGRHELRCRLHSGNLQLRLVFHGDRRGLGAAHGQQQQDGNQVIHGVTS